MGIFSIYTERDVLYIEAIDSRIKNKIEECLFPRIEDYFGFI